MRWRRRCRRGGLAFSLSQGLTISVVQRFGLNAQIIHGRLQIFFTKLIRRDACVIFDLLGLVLSQFIGYSRSGAQDEQGAQGAANSGASVADGRGAK